MRYNKEYGFKKGYRLEIYPTQEQKQYIDNCIDVTRYVYNWALAKEIENYQLYKEGKVKTQQLGEKRLRKMLLEEKKKNNWLCTVANETLRNSLHRLSNSYDFFFRNITTKPPKFKKKKRCKQSFTVRTDRFYIDRDRLRIEGLPRRQTISINFDTKFTKKDTKYFHSPTITRDNTGRYWISFVSDKVIDRSDYFKKYNIQKSDVIGIDLNKKKRWVLSTGEVFMEPNIEKLAKRLNRIDNKVNKDIFRYKKMKEKANPELVDDLYSKRAEKRRIKSNKINRTIHNVVTNYNYNVVNTICRKNPKAIVMEHLNEKSMVRGKRHIARILHKVPFLSMRLMMEYKCKEYKIPFKLAPRNYPSSQICSRCGNRKNIGSKKIYICDVCGLSIDRDINAAINLKNLA